MTTTGINTIVLPWPDARLSPNARTHWAQKARAAKLAREGAHWEALKAIGIMREKAPDRVAALKAAERIGLFLDFYPRDRRRRDDDNLLAMFKPYRDGLADALRIDDSRFISHPRLMPYDSKRRAVVLVTLTIAEPTHPCSLQTAKA